MIILATHTFPIAFCPFIGMFQIALKILIALCQRSSTLPAHHNHLGIF